MLVIASRLNLAVIGKVNQRICLVTWFTNKNNVAVKSISFTSTSYLEKLAIFISKGMQLEDSVLF